MKIDALLNSVRIDKHVKTMDELTSHLPNNSERSAMISI